MQRASPAVQRPSRRRLKAAECSLRALRIALLGLISGWAGLGPLSAVERPFLNEFMAANSGFLRDEDGDSSDWIEIYNPSENSVSLAGWFLTDATNALTKWAFPDVLLGPGGYLVVFASDKNRTNPAAPLHTNFKLASEGEYLALVDPATNVVSDFFPAYPAQQPDVSYGRARLETAAVGYFVAPTPGEANSASGSGFAPAVKFSRPSGTFQTDFALELSLGQPDAGALIHYTLDGSMPTNASPVFTSPIAITNSVQVRARAFADALLPGPPASELFFALGTGATEISSELPIILLHTMGGGGPPAEGERFVAMAVFEPRFGRASLLDPPDLVTRARFNTRGNTTANYPKQSWNFEAWDEFDADHAIPLLGMPADSDWVFYGPNNLEPVLIHNPFIHELSRRIGRYSPRTRFAEVYLNVLGGATGLAHYNGIYVIEEKIKIAPTRVAIDELRVENVQPPQVTGGYLLKIDFVDPGEVGVDTAGRKLLFVEPREREMQLPAWIPQKLYLSNYFQQFYAALTGPDFQDPEHGYRAFIDVGSWIDHHLLQLLALNVDALGLSEFLYKPRSGPIVSGPLWDFDRAFFSTDGRETNPGIGRAAFSGFADFWPAPWWNRLFTDPDFFQAWIDRYQELRRGPMSTPALHGLVDSLVAQVLEAQPREQARWGSSAPPRGGYSNEVSMMKRFLADRAYFMDTNFLAPPRLSSLGGRIDAGFVLSMVVPGGATAYYTLDGSDPRAPGGEVSAQAHPYAQPIVLPSNAKVVARALDPAHRNLTGTRNPPLSSPWSGPSTATFIVNPLPLIVTEIMYHPAPDGPANANDAERFEYLELQNAGTASVDLTGVHFSTGIEFSFTGSAVTALAPGAMVLIVRDRAAFVARYGERPNIAGAYLGALDNGGERLRLEGPFGETIFDFAYRDDWYRVTDGLGFSLTLRHQPAGAEQYNERATWRPSAMRHGSPGSIDVPASFPAVVLNEILLRPANGSPAAVELWNSSGDAADLSGWFLSDDADVPDKYRFPAGTIILPDEMLVVSETSYNAPGNPNRFTFSTAGGTAWLFSADASGALTGYEHRLEFGPAALGISYSRQVDTLGREQFPATTPTLGLGNLSALVGPVVISEIMFHPPDRVVAGAMVDDPLAEYIELHNISNGPVPFHDDSPSTNAWRLRGGVEFMFPPDSSLPAGARVLIVGFRPSDQTRLDEFRAQYGVDVSVPILGPYQGKLDNSADRIDLTRPVVQPVPEAMVGPVTYVVVDRVGYSDSAPWPDGADGTGLSLHRLDDGRFGNDPAAWLAARPSPGRPYAGGNPPRILSQPADVHVVLGQAARFVVEADGPPLLAYQWRLDEDAIPGATNAMLDLTAVTSEQGGDYSVITYNNAGAVISRKAALTVALPPLISHGPANRSVPPGTRLTNTVVAGGSGPLRYQWLFNGAPVPDATNATLVLTNAQLDQAGTYEVIVTDDIGSITTRPATILVLVRPTFTRQPQPVFQTALEGDTITLSVEVSPMHPSLPTGYRWRRNSVTIAGQTNATLVFTLNDVIAPAGALFASNLFSVIVTNPASPGVISSNAVVLVLADSDRDRLPDGWENLYGLNRNDPTDANLDPDGDGLTNLQEYLAGTVPTNRLSSLALRLMIESDDQRALFVDGVSNKTYSVEWREALGAGRWQTLTNLPARATNWQGIVLDPYPIAEKRFYRLVTPQTGNDPVKP